MTSYAASKRRRDDLEQFCAIDELDPNVRLQIYIRTAVQMILIAKQSISMRNWDNAYIQLLKFTDVCFKIIVKHPDYQQKDSGPSHWILQQGIEAERLFEIVMENMEKEAIEDEMMEEEMILHPALSYPLPVSSRKGESRSNNLQAELRSRLQSLQQRTDDTKMKSSGIEGNTVVMDKRAAFALLNDDQDQPIQLTASSSHTHYPSIGNHSWIKPDLKQQSHHRLRPLHIPSKLIQQFTALANFNTRQLPDGIETCGLLAGTLVDDRVLEINTLILPKQVGSSDTCTMTHEEDIYDVCIARSLIIIGWIHTHPRQSCFLSSVDLHTQCSYQTMLPEAIAIVIAPTDTNRNVGVFRLTSPEGLDLIQKCRLTGFHPHPENVEIYSDAIQVNWRTESSMSVVDLR